MPGSIRRSTLLWVMAVLVPIQLHAQMGRVQDDLSLPSDILGGDRHYAVYLPPDYDSSTRSYPVLYLLHGAGDDQS